jgi:hypothetical protein
MEQHALENVNNCWNTNVSSYIETYGGQNSILSLNAVHFLPPVYFDISDSLRQLLSCIGL